jgi:hypothetical protein
MPWTHPPMFPSSSRLPRVLAQLSIPGPVSPCAVVIRQQHGTGFLGPWVGGLMGAMWRPVGGCVLGAGPRWRAVIR